MDTIITNSGTKLVDGVEYNFYPPPKVLVKVMDLRWAKKLVNSGSIRFGSLTTYRKWENSLLGDPNEGKGKYRVNQHSFQIESINPVYAWCASTPEICKARLNSLAENGDYNCVVRVHDPVVLINRVYAAITENNTNLHLHCGEILYNKGTDTDIGQLNAQKFHFNVFQKAPFFADDSEYRFSLTDSSFRAEEKLNIDLSIGNCSDILSIEDLPA